MKIGIISDSHDHIKNLAKAIQYLNSQSVELIYHCGDWISPSTIRFLFLECKPKAQVKGVLGNNHGDILRTLKRIQENNILVTLEQNFLQDKVDGKNIAVYHGQDKGITQALIRSSLYHVVFTGHTHKAVNQIVNKTLHLNPGGISDDQDSKISDNQSLAIYDTKSNKARIIKFLKEKV